LAKGSKKQLIPTAIGQIEKGKEVQKENQEQ
jgi:hypothetical protein